MSFPPNPHPKEQPSYRPPGPYPHQPDAPPKQGMPAWAWLLIGCAGVPILMLPIVAAILFPVFAQAREKARQTTCLTNEKQIALAFLMYSQDYDEKFPRSGAWQEVIVPYHKNKSLYVCPSAANVTNTAYGFNKQLANLSMEKVTAPAISVLLVETGQDVMNAEGGPEMVVTPGRHGGSGGKWNNFAFADGHCKSFPDRIQHNFDPKTGGEDENTPPASGTDE